MDCSRYLIQLVLISLSCVLLSNQMASDGVTNYECPYIDFSRTNNGIRKINITRATKCKNGRGMSGCCLDRINCDFNSSYIDLTMYGPPGYRMPCPQVCCPRNYMLPIPIPNITTTEDDNDLSIDVDDNQVD